ncbi:UDP-N-acetylglucosamine 2-epimerase [Methylocaldum marinum]|uniref:UDP-N-acetylglucosamine 2-epimerase n=1 Tax=Methylocaldum marinum TaxID=1432792 RepID=A0A286P4H5_9GAMM|nr:UDP-N-acetylglucosamine 2-epimerase (non-hydrolyzing) [Methylocaldum marinum]BBA37556.1 UDP-N-acetylglucosamine 2-epimerase [Methylocaldum marinum]
MNTIARTKKIFIVAGARPNFMKIAPIIRELRQGSYPFEYKLVHTGQHYDKEMSDVFFEELEIPSPDYHLDVGSGSHAEQTAKVMVRFEEICMKDRPDLVMVVGDVNSTLACSIVAKKLGIKVAHVEAGLRSGDIRMPEEVNRIVTDSISDYFFVTEKSGADHLLAEGKPKDSIHFVGHVMIDNLFHQVEKLNRRPETSFETTFFKQRHPSYGVVTLHRPSNVDNQETLAGIIRALTEVSTALPLIFPIHPRTQANIRKFGLTIPDGIVTTKPLSYMAFLNLFKDARLVLTDSGGIQEETTALGIPCITLRENTERPITVEEGTNVIVGSDPERIVAEAKKALSGSGAAGKRPELWDGKASVRILTTLSDALYAD